MNKKEAIPTKSFFQRLLNKWLCVIGKHKLQGRIYNGVITAKYANGEYEKIPRTEKYYICTREKCQYKRIKYS